MLARHDRIDVLVNNAWGGHDHHEEVDGEEVWDEPMTQFKDMLLAGAYSDFVTDMTVLKHAMGPGGSRGDHHDHLAHAREYGFTGLDGSQPDLNAGRFVT